MTDANKIEELQHKLDIANDMHAGAVMVIQQLEARAKELEAKNTHLLERINNQGAFIEHQRTQLEAAEKLINTYREFKFLQEDYKVKESLSAWENFNMVMK